MSLYLVSHSDLAVPQNACEKILERLRPIREANPKGSWEDWVGAAWFDRISLSATGFHRSAIPPLPNGANISRVLAKPRSYKEKLIVVTRLCQNLGDMAMMLILVWHSSTEDINYDVKTNTGKAYEYHTFGASCSEVEVDCLTGDHKVRPGEVW